VNGYLLGILVFAEQAYAHHRIMFDMDENVRSQLKNIWLKQKELILRNGRSLRGMLHSKS